MIVSRGFTAYRVCPFQGLTGCALGKVTDCDGFFRGNGQSFVWNAKGQDPLPPQTDRRELSLNCVEVEDEHRAFASSKNEDPAVAAESIVDVASQLIGIKCDQRLGLALFTQGGWTDGPEACSWPEFIQFIPPRD